MRRELIWAGIIGISFGLIIAFGAWRITSFNNKSATTSVTPTPQATTSELKITLDKPENNDVVTQASTTVSGITKSLSWVTVSGEKGDYIVQADEAGVFAQDVDLVSGVNQIKVTAFDSGGNQSVQKVLVVFSSSFQIQSPAPSPGDTSSESAIRARVQEKVAEALNKPKAYIGVVTDIADSTIEIKSTDSEIQQISVSGDGITVINFKGTNNKTVKLTDIAIGDFIVAMGYVNSKSVLSAQRILITDPVTEPKINSTFAKVTANSKKILTIAALIDGQTQNISPDTKTDIESFDTGKLTVLKLGLITPGDLVIFVTDSSGDIPVIRSIFRVQKAQS